MSDLNDLNKPNLTSSYANGDVPDTILGHIKRLWAGDYTGMANLVTGMRRWVSTAGGNVQLKQRNAIGGEDVVFDSANYLSKSGGGVTGPVTFAGGVPTSNWASGGLAPLEAFSDNTNGSGPYPALIGLNRGGAFAAYVGLDTDNQLKFGGYTMGAAKHKIWHEGNFDAYRTLNGKSISLPQDTDLQLWAASLPPDGSYWISSATPQNALPANDWFIDISTWAGSTTNNVYQTLKARSFNSPYYGVPVNIEYVNVNTPTGWTGWKPLGGGLQGNSILLTTSGTWVCPAGVSKVKRTMVGGGGGGGAGGNANSATGTDWTGSGGGAGGAGEVVQDWVSVIAGTSYPYTIGAGRYGGAETSNTSGANGGWGAATSMFSVVADGGTGGTGGNYGGALYAFDARGGAGGDTQTSSISSWRSGDNGSNSIPKFVSAGISQTRTRYTKYTNSGFPFVFVDGGRAPYGSGGQGGAGSNFISSNASGSAGVDGAIYLEW